MPDWTRIAGEKSQVTPYWIDPQYLAALVEATQKRARRVGVTLTDEDCEDIFNASVAYGIPRGVPWYEGWRPMLAVILRLKLAGQHLPTAPPPPTGAG